MSPAGEAAPGVKAASVAAPGARVVSIAELFKLSAEDLYLRCVEEGVRAGRGDPKARARLSATLIYVHIYIYIYRERERYR